MRWSVNLILTKSDNFLRVKHFRIFVMAKHQVDHVEEVKQPIADRISSIGSGKDFESYHGGTPATEEMALAREVTRDTPMTFKRSMALISLTLLFVTSVAPTIFISSSLGTAYFPGLSFFLSPSFIDMYLQPTSSPTSGVKTLLLGSSWQVP